MRQANRLTALLLAACAAPGGPSTDDTAGVGCASIGPEGGTLVSRDGRLTLQVPAGALADPTEVCATAVAPTDLDPGLQQAPPAAAYELGPDGTTFAEPVRVTWRWPDPLARTGNTTDLPLPVLASRSGEEASLLGDQRVAVDLGDGTLEVSGDLTHFSQVFGVVESELLLLSLEVPDEATGPFSAVVRIRIDARFSPHFAGSTPTWKDASGAPVSFVSGPEGTFSDSVLSLSCGAPGAGLVAGELTTSGLFGEQAILVGAFLGHLGVSSLAQEFHVDLRAPVTCGEEQGGGASGADLDLMTLSEFQDADITYYRREQLGAGDVVKRAVCATTADGDVTAPGNPVRLGKLEARPWPQAPDDWSVDVHLTFDAPDDNQPGASDAGVLQFQFVGAEGDGEVVVHDNDYAAVVDLHRDAPHTLSAGVYANVNRGLAPNDPDRCPAGEYPYTITFDVTPDGATAPVRSSEVKGQVRILEGDPL